MSPCLRMSGVFYLARVLINIIIELLMVLSAETNGPVFDSVPEGDAMFTLKLQDYSATEKEEVSLDCELSKDVPVVWYHNEKEVTASKMVVLRSEGTRRALVLKKVEQNDKGTYVCDCGTDKTSANIHIEGI